MRAFGPRPASCANRPARQARVPGGPHPHLRVRSVASGTLAGLLLAAGLGCATGAPSPDPVSLTSCDRLGWALYVLAGYRDRGDSREDQIRWANAAIEPDAPRKTTLLLIDRIHRERLSALPLGVDIIRRCDPEAGRAVVSRRATR